MNHNQITKMWVDSEFEPYLFAEMVAKLEREECALLCEEERINAVHYSAPTQSNWLAIKIRNKQ
jgi:hypothetical protein